MPGYPFFVGTSGIANSAGEVVLRLGPTKANEEWTIEHQSVSNPGPRIPEVNVYKNFVADSAFIEGTINGKSGSSDTLINLMTGEIVLYVWTGATPGTLCTVNVRGTRTIAG